MVRSAQRGWLLLDRSECVVPAVAPEPVVREVMNLRAAPITFWISATAFLMKVLHFIASFCVA